MLKRAWPVPVLAFAVAALVYAAWPLTPKRYYSGATMRLVAQRVPPGVVSPVDVLSSLRVMDFKPQVLSRTSLERLVTEFHLHEGLRNQLPMEAYFDRIRQDIDIGEIPSTAPGVPPQIRVGFVYHDPQTCKRVADRLLAAVLNVALNERVRLADGTRDFLAAQVDEARARVINKIKAVAAARSAGRTEDAHVLALESEAQDEEYKALLTKVADFRLRDALLTTRIGEHTRVEDWPQVPERPLGPTRNGATAVGGTIGAVLGLLWMAVRASKPA